MTMAMDARMRKDLKRGGTRDQKIRRRSITAVSSARAAVVMGMYMLFVGYPVSTSSCNERSDLIYKGVDRVRSGVGEKMLERMLIAPAAQRGLMKER
jgi:hypothetical protein